ncbi:MAG: protein-L-isoaspartate(D-aspartate) O-methyltransferase [Myxococcota bacterium]
MPGSIDGRLGPLTLLAALSAGCGGGGRAEPPEPEVREPDWSALRDAMVDGQIAARGVEDPRVLAAMRRVPRHELVPPEGRAFAYDDRPVPVGYGQPMSQPYVVARMSALADVAPGERVLEIGTGSGYQAAVLAELGAEVHTIEIVPELGDRAAENLRRLGYARVRVRIGDGTRGWPEAAPFDAIVVTAAPAVVPPALLQQLALGGRLVVPVGARGDQELRVIARRGETEWVETRGEAVRFVPMTGAAARLAE